MRGFLVAAMLMMAGSAGQAQYVTFAGPGGEPIVIDIPRRCDGPSCVYVRVPGHVEIGTRPYVPPPPAAYYGPPPAYYGPPRTAPPEFVDDEDEPPYYEPPRRYETVRPYGPSSRIRQPKQITSAPKKKTPKVAAVRDISPVRTPANRAAALPQKPLSAVAPPATAAAPPPPSDVGGAPQAAPLSPATLAAPASEAPAAENPAPAVAAAPPPAPERAQAPVAPAIPPAAAKPSKTVVAALPPAKQETEERANAATAMPIGIWSSGDGQVRIQRCGDKLCGYAVGGAHAGKMVLIHMRQTKDNSWSGQVNDVRSAQNYSATMSMRGPDALNIQGCALGGLFCGSRTMSRVR